jgi:prepilin-type N-terminal cleavage/methylation domain-containing protein
MKARGYSLVEVMVAAAVIAIGLTASAVLVGTLTQQEEVNAAALRAANLQEQAVRLYRLDVDTALITALLPESSTYSVSFTPANDALSFEVDGTQVLLDAADCTMTYPNPAGDGTNLSNTVTVIRPTIRAAGN